MAGPPIRASLAPVSSGVVVLGMHRSGTSAATRLVNLLGVPLAADDLLPAAFDNPSGHWESRTLVELNDRVLAARGLDWTCPDAFEPGWPDEPPVAALRPEAAASFERAVRTPRWVWKDPRNCLLLPFWTEALDLDPLVVLVLRNPLEIVASIEARDRFGRPYSIALWERYMRVCLRDLAGRRTIVTSYETLLEDPVAWCEGTARFLRGSAIPAAPATEADVRSFVEPGLRHERSTWPELEADPAFSEPQRVLARVLERTSGEHDAFTTPELPPETATTEELLGERRRALLEVRRAAMTSSS